MGDLYLTDMADILRGGGIPVQEVYGWQRRARASGGYNGRIEGFSIHHTASGPFSDGWPSVNYGTFNAPARPIANCYVDRQGTWYIAAAGGTNTSGAGGPLGNIPRDGANSRTIGIEIMNGGTGEEYPAAQQMRVLHGVALLWNVYAPRYNLGFPNVGNMFGHFEWAPTRKCDPTGLSNWSVPVNFSGCNRATRWYMDNFRSQVLHHALSLIVPPRSLSPDAIRACISATKPQRAPFDGANLPDGDFLVKYLQIVLTEMAGQDGITQSGVFDGATYTGTRNLQSWKGLHVDGIVGEQTWPVVDDLARHLPGI